MLSVRARCTHIVSAFWTPHVSKPQWHILDNADIVYNWLINPIVQCLFWEANTSLPSYEILLNFFEPEVQLPCSQKPVNSEVLYNYS
jgi:hypothetical protein